MKRPFRNKHGKRLDNLFLFQLTNGALQYVDALLQQVIELLHGRFARRCVLLIRTVLLSLRDFLPEGGSLLPQIHNHHRDLH